MGSYSSSSTSYSSTAPTVQDNENPVVLTNSSGVQMGNGLQIQGSNSGVLNLLDGGAIERAFGFADKSIAAVADLTAKLMSNTSASNVAALDFTGRANAAANALANPDAAAETMTNKTLWIFGGLVALYFLTKGKLNG